MQTFYKAVPMEFLNSIKDTGLDPQKAGQRGGATASAMATGRQATGLDYNYTWVNKNKSRAIGYAQSSFVGRSPVLLKIIVPDQYEFEDQKTAGHGTRQLIPPVFIYFQTKKGSHWESIANFTKDKAFIYDDELSDESSGDDW